MGWGTWRMRKFAAENPREKKSLSPGMGGALIFFLCHLIPLPAFTCNLLPSLRGAAYRDPVGTIPLGIVLVGNRSSADRQHLRHMAAFRTLGRRRVHPWLEPAVLQDGLDPSGSKQVGYCHCGCPASRPDCRAISW